jgi:hypothetical protein
MIEMAAPAVNVASQQLARIDYGRPESWNFFFWAKLSNGSAAVGPTNDVTVAFDLIIGLGRSSIVVPNFETFVWTINTDVGQERWSTSVEGPKRSAADVNPNLIRELAAQSINCTARASLGFTPSTATIQVAAQFAPVQHIRPEWFEQRFPGDETEGH